MDTKFAEYANLQKKYEIIYENDKQKSKILEQGKFLKSLKKKVLCFFCKFWKWNKLVYDCK